MLVASKREIAKLMVPSGTPLQWISGDVLPVSFVLPDLKQFFMPIMAKSPPSVNIPPGVPPSVPELASGSPLEPPLPASAPLVPPALALPPLPPVPVESEPPVPPAVPPLPAPPLPEPPALLPPEPLAAPPLPPLAPPDPPALPPLPDELDDPPEPVVPPESPDGEPRLSPSSAPGRVEGPHSALAGHGPVGARDIFRALDAPRAPLPRWPPEGSNEIVPSRWIDLPTSAHFHSIFVTPVNPDGPRQSAGWRAVRNPTAEEAL